MANFEECIGDGLIFNPATPSVAVNVDGSTVQMSCADGISLAVPQVVSTEFELFGGEITVSAPTSVICENGLKQNCDGEVWTRPDPCIGPYISQGKRIRDGHPTANGTSSETITIPIDPPCGQAAWLQGSVNYDLDANFTEGVDNYSLFKFGANTFVSSGVGFGENLSDYNSFFLNDLNSFKYINHMTSIPINLLIFNPGSTINISNIASASFADGSGFYTLDIRTNLQIVYISSC